jgi:UDP-N-acetylmuramate: L-alanyl-gamma-D-glutamyl-meso-diaminopimelate ligase
LLFYDNPEKLTAYIEKQELAGKNLLLMSSGNFGGINLNELTIKLLNKYS